MLLSEEYSASRGVYIRCIYSGDYDKVVNKAKERLWIYPYMGTFFGIDAFMPDVENMFYTRPFYIPNANVQDLT